MHIDSPPSNIISNTSTLVVAYHPIGTYTLVGHIPTIPRQANDRYVL